jgi:hypothetical protein
LEEKEKNKMNEKGKHKMEEKVKHKMEDKGILNFGREREK